MGRKPISYKLTNINTKEEIVCTSDEVCEKFGFTNVYLTKAYSAGRLLRKEWKIERVGPEKVYDVSRKASDVSKKVPKDKQEEWDKVTAPFKKLYAKKVSRA